MCFLVLEEHDLVGLELPELFLDLLLGELVCIANVHVFIEDLVVEDLGELDGCFVKDRLVLVNAYYMWHSCFYKDPSNLFRVTTCYVYKLKVCLLVV